MKWIHPTVSARPSGRCFLAATLAAGALVLAAAGSFRAQAGQVTDDFGDGDDAGWSRYDPIGTLTGVPQDTFGFPAGGYRLQANPTPNPQFGPGRVGSLRPDLTVASFQVSVDLVGWDDSLSQAMGVIARTQTPGPGTTQGYIFGYVAGAGQYAQIVRVTREGTSTIAGSPPVPLTLDPARPYRLLFQGRADRLEARIFALPNLTEPIAVLTATDGAYGDGTTGLIAFSLNSAVPEGVDVTYDNFYAVDTVPPTLEYRDLGFGLIQLLWPGDAGSFKLECSDTLPAAAWTVIDDSLVSYFADLDRYIYQHDASIGQKFFRLRRP